MKEIAKKNLRKIKIMMSGLVLVLGGMFALSAAPVYANSDDGDGDDSAQETMELDSDCAEILKVFCPQDGDNGDAIVELFKFVVNILAAGVVVAGTIGIIVCSMMWMTARENENQVRKAKTRLVEIVIGMVLFIMIDLVINMLLGRVDWR